MRRFVRIALLDAENRLELTSLKVSVNVDGSMLGNSLRATGSKSSMKGTMRKTENGMRRRRSCVVLLSYHPVRPHQLPSFVAQYTIHGLTCLLSRLVNFLPANNLPWILAEILISFPSNLVPCQ